LRLRGGVIEPSLAVLARKFSGKKHDLTLVFLNLLKIEFFVAL